MRDRHIVLTGDKVRDGNADGCKRWLPALTLAETLLFSPSTPTVRLVRILKIMAISEVSCCKLMKYTHATHTHT